LIFAVYGASHFLLAPLAFSSAADFASFVPCAAFNEMKPFNLFSAPPRSNILHKTASKQARDFLEVAGFSMKRRTFLAASALTMLAPRLLRAADANASRDYLENNDWSHPRRALRGVNLGNWLLLEKWMGGEAFVGTNANDEWTLSGLPDGRERIEKHRSTWITEADFAWIKARGLDAVRLPVGYWALGDDAPYFSAKTHLDNAFLWAKNQGLQILLDLHGAPGSQNGRDNSGRIGPTGWNTPDNRAKTLAVLEGLAREYGAHPNLWGLEILNEPDWSLSVGVLEDFGSQAYARLRPLLLPSCAFVYHDGFRGSDWGDHLSGPAFQNVARDTHPYQIYTAADKSRAPIDQLKMALERRGEIERMGQNQWIVVGEWSAALSWDAVKNLPSSQRLALARAYANAQLWSYEGAHAWFYWSYKTGNGGDWSFRDSVERGVLPATF